MTIDEAIENLQDTYDFCQSVFSTEDLEAIKLGIEALKRIKLQRSPRGFGYSYKLPGESN